MKQRLVIIVTVLFLVAGCGDKNTYVPPPPPKVEVSQPLVRPVTDYLEFTGNVVAYQTVRIGRPVAASWYRPGGRRLHSLCFDQRKRFFLFELRNDV